MDLFELCARGPGAHQQPVIDFLQSVFADNTQDYWNQWFEGRDICYAPVLSLYEAHHDPHASFRGMTPIDDDGLRHVGNPIHFANEPAVLDFAVPQLGQHTRSVFKALDYNDSQLDLLTGQ